MRLTLKTALALGILNILFSCSTPNESSEEEGEFETDGIELAMRQEVRMTRDPNLGYVPIERLGTARTRLQSLEQTARMLALTWQERGPNNIGGRTRTILVDRRDASGNTVLAASVSGGIFRTTNFMSAQPTWVPVNDKLLNLAVTAMRQDPKNPAVMYAGTGEGWFNLDAVMGAGIFKSTDGGITWNLLSSTANYFDYVQDIEIDNNGALYASVRNDFADHARGVQRSTNGGASWIQVLGAPLPGFQTGRAADLEVATNGDVYATLCIGLFRTVVMKSSFALNGANTGALGKWDEITPVHSTPTKRGELAVAPSNSNRLYLMLEDSADSKVSRIYRSNDAGVTWDSLPAPSALNNGDVSQAWYNMIAAVDPTNADIVYVGALHLARSVDGGSNWTNITSSSSGVHVDQHELVYFAPDKLYVGNDGGVYFSANPSASTPTFQNKNNSYNVTQFYGVDYHPTNANYYLAGAQDNNTQKFNSPGINNTSVASGGDGGFPHIDQTDGKIQITSATNNNYFRSINGGQSFSYQSGVSNNRGQFINPTDYDDVADVLYCGDDAGKYYYITNWLTTPAGQQVSLSKIGTREVTAVKWDPFGPNIVWLGASFGGVKPMLVKLGDANTTAPKVLTSALLDLPSGAYISSIDIDPGNWMHLVTTVSNYGVASVFESTDGGKTWVDIEGNLPDIPVRWGMFLPASASVDGTKGGGILLGTELGVWFTQATARSSTVWSPETSNLPNVRVDMLKFRASDNLLLAATHGRGLFSTTLTALSTGVSTVPDTREFIRYISASQQELFIKVGNLTTTKMQVSIYDANGRLVRSANSRYADQRINVGRLARGTYVVKIYGNKQEHYTRQFVK